MPEPFLFLSGFSQAAVSSLQFVEFIIELTNCPEDVKTCFSLVKRAHDDVHFALELRTKHRILLLQKPRETNRINSIIASSLESLQDIGVLVERVRADANGGRIDILRRLRWVLGDSASFVARTSNLQAQHAAILSEIAYLRTLDMVQPLIDAVEHSTWENVEFLGPSKSMRRPQSLYAPSSKDVETPEVVEIEHQFKLKRSSLEIPASSRDIIDIGPHFRHWSSDTLFDPPEEPEVLEEPKAAPQYKYWGPDSFVAPKSPQLAAREPSAHRILELPAEVVPLNRAVSTGTVSNPTSPPARSETPMSLYNFVSSETLVGSTFDREEQTFELEGPSMIRLPGVRYNAQFTDNISFADTSLDLSLEENFLRERMEQAGQPMPARSDAKGPEAHVSEVHISDVSGSAEDQDFEEAFFRDWRMQEQESRGVTIT